MAALNDNSNESHVSMGLSIIEYLFSEWVELSINKEQSDGVRKSGMG